MCCIRIESYFTLIVHMQFCFVIPYPKEYDTDMKDTILTIFYLSDEGRVADAFQSRSIMFYFMRFVGYKQTVLRRARNRILTAIRFLTI